MKRACTPTCDTVLLHVLPTLQSVNKEAQTATQLYISEAFFLLLRLFLFFFIEMAGQSRKTGLTGAARPGARPRAGTGTVE